MRVFEKLIPLLSTRLQKNGAAILVGSHERIPIKRESFQGIVPVVGNRLVFVDSGSGEVLSGPNVCVCFLRVYSGWYERNVRVSREVNEFVVLVCAVPKDLDVRFEASLLTLDGDEVKRWEFDAFDPALCFGGRRAEPSAVVGYVRRLVEFEEMERVVGLLSQGDIVVRDGDLDARGSVLEAARLSLRLLAQKRGVVVLGLSKTSRLCTDSGNSALVALRGIAPEGAWSYYGGSEVGFVKLHPSSHFVFRCDVFSHDKDCLSSAWSALAGNSGDPAMLGYPYGLLDADRSAQVSKDELDQLRWRFALLSRESFRDVEFALNAHDFLNSF